MYVSPVETGRPKLYHPVARIDGADYANILSWEIQHFANTTAVYHPRKPTNSPLYRLLYDHFDHFDHFEQIYAE